MRKIILFLTILFLNSICGICQGKKDSILKNSDSLFIEGKYTQAIENLKQHQGLFPNNAQAEIADLSHKIGIEYWEDSLELALVWWRDSALQKRIDAYGLQDFRTIKTKHNVAMAYNNLDQRTEEFVLVEEIIDQVQAGLKDLSAKDTSSLVKKFFDYAILYRDVEDFNKTEQCLNKIKYLIKNDVNTSNLARLNEHFGMLYNFKGNHLKAKEFLQKSIRIEPSTNRHYNIALIYYELNELDSAYFYGQKARAAYQEKVNKDTLRMDSENLSLCYKVLGLISRKDGNYEQALLNLQKSIAIIKSNSSDALIPNVGLAVGFENMGDIYFDQENYQKALNYYQQSLTKLGIKAYPLKSFKDNPLSANIGTTELNETIRVLGLKIEALYHLYKKDQQKEHLEIALNTSNTVDSLVRRFRLFNKKGEDKFSLTETVLPYYEYSILVAHELFNISQDQNNLKKAYQALLNIKGIALLEEIKNKKILAELLPKRILKEEAQLREEVYKIENLLSLARGPEKIELIQKHINATANYDRQVKKIEKLSPEYYHAKFDYQNANSLEAIQEKLSADALIFDFLEGEQALYVFGISKGLISLEIIPNKERIQTAIQKINQSLALNLIHDNAAFLYSSLLQNTMAKHGGEFDHLIFVKSGFLHDLPFDLLKTKQQNYLIEACKLSDLYSAEQLLQKTKRFNKTFQYLGFAIDYADLNEAQRYFLDSSVYLNQLSFVNKEINYSEDIFKGKRFFNTKVSTSRLREYLSEANIIHFSTHAISAQDVLQSGLIVYDTQEQLSIFNKNDIMANNLSNDLTILSACHTGAGKKYKGEGVMSLARAFFNAGSQSVLVSTNAASDYSSQQINRLFLDQIKAGKTKHEALQLAKLNYLAEAAPAYQHPKYWAYFSIIGNTDAIVFPQSGWIKYIVIFADAIIILLFLLRSRKNQS